MIDKACSRIDRGIVKNIIKEIFQLSVIKNTTRGFCKLFVAKYSTQFPEANCEVVPSKHPEAYRSLNVTINSDNINSALRPEEGQLEFFQREKIP